MCVKKKLISVPVINSYSLLGLFRTNANRHATSLCMKTKNNGMSFQINYFHSSLVVWRHRMFSELVSDFLRATVMAPCISFIVNLNLFLKNVAAFKIMLRMYPRLRAFFFFFPECTFVTCWRLMTYN